MLNPWCADRTCIRRLSTGSNQFTFHPCRALFRSVPAAHLSLTRYPIQEPNVNSQFPSVPWGETGAGKRRRQEDKTPGSRGHLFAWLAKNPKNSSRGIYLHLCKASIGRCPVTLWLRANIVQAGCFSQDNGSLTALGNGALSCSPTQSECPASEAPNNRNWSPQMQNTEVAPQSSRLLLGF